MVINVNAINYDYIYEVYSIIIDDIYKFKILIYYNIFII